MSVPVSVVMPYRDAAATIDEAIESVLGQREVELELIAIDDGSTDDSAARVARFAKRDPRVRGLRAPGRGIVGALREGVRAASSSLLARMDADDVCLPDRLRLQLALLRGDASFAAVGTRVEAFPAEAVGAGTTRYLAWMNALVTAEDHARDIFVESPLCHPSVVVRREALDAVGGFREVAWPEDYDLWLRLDAAGFRLGKVPEVLLRWRSHPRQTTRMDPRCSEERLREGKAGFLAHRLRGMARPIAVWGAGQTGRRLARALSAHGVHAERFYDIDPRKVGRTRRGVPVLAPGALRPGTHTIVVAVGAPGARDIVRGRLSALGCVEGVDFVCAA